MPSHVQVPAGEGGLTLDSAALGEQVRVIDQGRLFSKSGELSQQRIQEFDAVLRPILDS
jgi:mRNA-degrading endonuclease toxin of MazEF toxin-antitoxin module